MDWELFAAEAALLGLRFNRYAFPDVQLTTDHQTTYNNDVLANLCERHGIAYTRRVDDLFVVVPRQSKAFTNLPKPAQYDWVANWERKA